MILVILAFFLAMMIVGIILECKYDNGLVPELVGGFGALIVVLAAVLIGIDVANLKVIDDRIAMYQEENAVIEQQIADVVEQYRKYETDIFMEVAPESAVTMVALYPELKSDSLVQAQIEVYVANNNMIKDLKDQQIKGDVYRWWLYFGGGKDNAAD